MVFTTSSSFPCKAEIRSSRDSTSELNCQTEGICPSACFKIASCSAHMCAPTKSLLPVDFIHSSAYRLRTAFQKQQKNSNQVRSSRHFLCATVKLLVL